MVPSMVGTIGHAHETPSAASHGHAMLIANLLAQISFGLLAMTICLPSMQEWGAIFGAEQAAVQLTFSGFVIAFGGFQLVHGPLSDRFGRKAILMTGLSLACAGSLLAALATDIGSLTAARVLQGAGSAASMVIGRSLVQDLFQGAQRTRVMAYLGMAMGLCPPLATIVGGQLHVHVGWQANFLLISAMAAVLLVTAWRGLPAQPRAVARGTHWLGDMGTAYARLARAPAFLLYVTVLALTTATFFTFLSGAPVVLGRYGVGPGGIGWYVMFATVSYMAGNYLTSRLVHRLGERRMMAWGQALTLCGLGLMLALALAGFDTSLAFAMPLILVGIGHGFLMPPCLAGTVGVIPALAGSAAAVAGTMQQVGGGLAGYAVGLLPDGTAVGLAGLMTTFTLCAAAAQWVLHRR